MLGLATTPSSERRSPACEPVRVVMADDHPVFREGLAGLLTASGIEVVGEAANGRAAVDAVERTAPDVVVMDLNMPGLSGAALQGGGAAGQVSWV